MKKVLLVSALVMTIVASMVSGTLAVYQTILPDIAAGSVFAKKFVLKQEGTSTTFAAPLKIAPKDKKELTFSVKNYDGPLVTTTDISEVDMNVQVNIELGIATDATKAITPLTVTVYKGDITGTPVVATGTLLDGTGTLTCDFSSIFVGDVPDEQIFTVVVEWPELTTGIDDADFAGPTFGTSLTVSVTGIQKT